MTTLFENPYCVITRELDGRVIRVRRTSEPVRDATDFATINVELSRVVPLSSRARVGILIDARDGPLIMNEALERETAQTVANMATGFARGAVLMKTAVGLLQAKRIRRENPSPGVTEVEIFEDEQAALSFASGSATGPLSGPVVSRRSNPTNR